MIKLLSPNNLKRTIFSSVLAMSVLAGTSAFAQDVNFQTVEQQKTRPPFACTSLRITDTKGNVYHGRGMEFSSDQMITNLTYYPVGHVFQHEAPDKSPGLKYTAKYPILALTTPLNAIEKHESTEGLNAAGLSFSLNMITNSEINEIQKSDYARSVPFASIGEWAIANFATVKELKAGMKNVPFWSQSLALVGGLKSPFHFAFYDKTGESIVVEVSKGIVHVYDNPTGVMTNGPEFPWHLTNLNNYSNLTNVDKSSGKFGSLTLEQPDSGIATSLLPSSQTSVGRFVRAFYYSTFANKVDDPDTQIVELGHVMNNFDRPKNITVDTMSEGGNTSVNSFMTEYTLWIALSDLSRGHFYVRMYNSLNYTKHTFEQYKNEKKMVSFALN